MAHFWNDVTAEIISGLGRERMASGADVVAVDGSKYLNHISKKLVLKHNDLMFRRAWPALF